MTYELKLKNEKIATFSVYSYHYQDIDSKNQFDIDFINLIALYEKTENEFRFISFQLINLKDYLIRKLPTNDLYKTNKVLILEGIRPPSQEETKIYLTNQLKQIEEILPKTIPFFELESDT